MRPFPFRRLTLAVCLLARLSLYCHIAAPKLGLGSILANKCYLNVTIMFKITIKYNQKLISVTDVRNVITRSTVYKCIDSLQFE